MSEIIGAQRTAAIARAASAELARRSLLDFGALVYPDFSAPAHIRLIACQLKEIEAGRLRRLLVNLPPRHGKSLLCSQLFPAWYLGRHPRADVIVATHSQELSDKNSRIARSFVEDDLWPFGTRLSQESAAVGRWNTTDGGGLFAVGVEGSVTGRGANLLILDDLLHDAGNEGEREAAWEWFTTVAVPRLEPAAAIVAIGTRLHEDDIFGRLLSAPDAATWRVIRLPAIAVEDESDLLGRKPGEALWPERIALAELEERRLSMGSRAFESQFQQNPIPAEGHVFKAPWFERRYRELPQLEDKCIAIDSAWKTGAGNDYSVIACWGRTNTDYYLVNVWRGKVEFPDLKRIVVEHYFGFGTYAVVVEEAASGFAIVQELKRETGIPIIPVTARGSKQSRAEAIAPLFESGKIVLPEGQPWLESWIEEHLRFPNGAHDDMVDTTSLALERLKKMPFVFAGAIGGDEDEELRMLQARRARVIIRQGIY